MYSPTDYRQLNFKVMTDTVKRCEEEKELIDAIQASIEGQRMYEGKEKLKPVPCGEGNTPCCVSPRRSFEAAKEYKGKRVAVLNFANNRLIGGSPFSAGAQEESLCRCSTLYPCLQAMKQPFYDKHTMHMWMGMLDSRGNDDLIWTPDVVVFKTDVSAPEMLPHEEWYKVDILTCAAPIIPSSSPNSLPKDYEKLIRSRLKHVLDVAALNGDEVLILGAWGCGAFHNPPKIVARVFHELLRDYSFEAVEFAIGGTRGENYDVFRKEFGK